MYACIFVVCMSTILYDDDYNIFINVLFYRRTSEVALEDIRFFFLLATGHNVNYHYVVYVLQDIARRSNKCPEQNIYEK